MKRFFPFIIILIFFSCNNSDEETIVLLDETIESANQILDAQTDMLYADIASKYHYNKTKFQFFKNVTDTIDVKHKNIIKVANNIKDKYEIDYFKENRSFLKKNIRYKTEKLLEIVNKAMLYNKVYFVYLIYEKRNYKLFQIY